MTAGLRLVEPTEPLADDLVRLAIAKVATAISSLSMHSTLDLPLAPAESTRVADALGQVISLLRGLLPDDAVASRKAP
jgi:hypothetical protein